MIRMRFLFVSGREILFFLLIFMWNTVAHSTDNILSCPGAIVNPADAVVHQQVTPRGNAKAGKYYQIKSVNELATCMLECCGTLTCDVVFMYQTNCYLISCKDNKACEPVHRPGKKFADSYMVQLRSADNKLTSLENDYQDHTVDPNLRIAADTFLDEPLLGDRRSLQSSSRVNYSLSTICEFGLKVDCPVNEECVPKNNRARNGFCVCIEGYERDTTTGECILKKAGASFNETPSIVNITSSQSPVTLSSTTPEPVTTKPTSTIKKLIVSAGDNKEIQLPENEVSLSAFALPKEPEGEHYRYEWTLVSQREGDDTGTMGDKNSATLKLMALKEGLYTFKVTVTGKDAYGEAFVNVTVLPPKRINKPPVAVINPVNQTVKLPNTETVLDGSASTDDDKIVTYHWEQVTAPINYQPQLTDTATLQLKDLVPGFYKFMLKVTDSDGSSNSTYANITVIKETDYPPSAVAPSDVIIYLPQNEVILNGNLSTDDKGIESWEWTKGPDTNKAVDMQNTRTPYLHLSNLEVGMYTFILKVTDTADQSSQAEVRVFVKPENNEAPTVDAGVDQEIILPIDSVLLDGSKSHDDVGIREWNWKQLSGPNQAKLDIPDQMKTNASGLTKGVYVFQLTVSDDKKMNSNKTVTITVKQTENQPPVAHAGGDRTIRLPANVVLLNGSSSTDDVSIVSYEWTRDPSSLAAGTIIEDSHHSPVLKVANLIPGRYVFRLKVTDEQGAFNVDSASLIVKPDIHENDDIEMQVNADIFWFSEEQKVTLANKLALLLPAETGENQVHIKEIAAARHSGRVILIFDVLKITDGKTVVVQKGPEVVQALKKKLKTDGSLLDFDVLSLDTVICQNNCSGHGACEQATKRCICKAFWMEDLLRFNFGDTESNCDWSILYVIVILFIAVVSIAGIIWAIICLCKRMRFRRPRKRHRYQLLEDFGDKEVLRGRSGKIQTSSLMASETETDSDTLFDKKVSNGKANGHLTNGFVRHPRKVRT